MRRTNLRGHALRGEGKAHVPGDEDPWLRAHGRGGHGLCECGETSDWLYSDAARKRWHADHKDEVYAVAHGITGNTMDDVAPVDDLFMRQFSRGPEQAARRRRR